MRRTYLSGSVDAYKLDDPTPFQWRAEISEFLKAIHIEPVNPLLKASQKNHKHRLEWRDSGQYGPLADSMRGVVADDLELLHTSDSVICYLDMAVPFCGTTEEILLAVDNGKPVYVVCRQGAKAIPLWLFARLDWRLFFDNFDALKDRLLAFKRN